MSKRDGNDGAERIAPGDGLPDAAWLEAIGLRELLPAPLVAWRPLVEEAARFFVERLPPERLAAILYAQLELGDDAPAAQRLVALLAQCPTLHKLGQVVARQPRLDAELRRHLQALESMPATVSIGPILERLRAELGDALPVEVAAEPLAQGSVAVVLPFTFREAGRPRGGVFKVLRPGVEARLDEELAIFPDLAAFVERRAVELGLPALDFRGTLASVRALLTQEIRLDLEQRHLRAAAAFYADDPRLLVPRVLPWCSARVTAMERVFGTKLTDARLPGPERRAFAATAIAALLAKPFWTRSDPAVFHGDLHGGNLLAADDGRLAVLDWSLVARVSKAEREALLAIALGALTLDGARIRRALAALGTCAEDDPTLAGIVERALDRVVRADRAPGFDWLVSLLDELAVSRAAGFGEGLALFRKSWLSLSGVLGDLAGPVAADAPLLGAGLRRFVAELPWRWFAPPGARDFSTHVSNADLVDLAASSWLAAFRYGSRVQALGLQRLRAVDA